MYFLTARARDRQLPMSLRVEIPVQPERLPAETEGIQPSENT